VRADVAAKHKVITCAMDKELYTEFRIQLYKHHLSASEAVAEFARTVALGGAHGLKVLELLANRKNRERIHRDACKVKAERARALKARQRVSLEEVDHDALYNLIEGDENEG
jgi:hypothetical protein